MQRRLAIFGTLVLAAGAALGQGRYEPAQDPNGPEEIRYTRYFTRDALDRRITFYVSKTAREAEDDRPLPLIAFILGSGAHSNFIERKGQVLDAHRILREEVNGRAHVLAVEKPGVQYLSQPTQNGTAIGASPEFLVEHTADRWTEAVNSAIEAARKLPSVDERKILVAGHSEGSRVAAMVAGANPAVTHLAGLSGFATSRLRCLMIGGDGYSDEKAMRAALLWRKMLAAPESLELFSGHTYRYWMSISRRTILENLLDSEADLYLAQGTRDEGCAIDGFELLHAQLIERGRHPVAMLVQGADHGFAVEGQPERDGRREQLNAMVNWFLSGASPSSEASAGSA